MNSHPKEGCTAGFHYGTSFSPCNGVLHWTKDTHTDGRQIAECDACGAKCVPNTQAASEQKGTSPKR